MAARLTDAEKKKRAQAATDKKQNRTDKKATAEKKKTDKKAAAEKKKTDKKAAAEKKKTDAAKNAAKKTTKAAKKTARAAVPAARKERKNVKREINDGEKRARTTYRTGNKGCRDTRKAAQAPHKEAIKKTRVDFDKCRRAVEHETVGIVAGLAPLESELHRLNALIPAPVQNYRGRHRQEQWGERLDEARAEILSKHPELAIHVDSFLKPMERYGSEASRQTRAHIDQLAQGRPVMSLPELVMQRAHEGGFSPTSGMRPGSDLQAELAGAASRAARTMMSEGNPASRSVVDEILSGARSTAAPSGPLPSSAFAFPPRSAAARTTPLFPGGQDMPIFAGPSAVDEIMASVRSTARPSRRGAPPRTQASPGSSKQAAGRRRPTAKKRAAPRKGKAK